MYGLIGKSLRHSFSPVIHREIGGYDYHLIELKEKEIPSFLTKRQFRGINVTVPYKEKVIPYLDEISHEARQIGAVNTIVNRNGRLFGYNTDVDGLQALIKRNRIELLNKKVLILGSGGTSKTAYYTAEKCGAKAVFRVSRSEKTPGCVTYQRALSEHNDADVIINTTPCGMYPDNDGMPIDIQNFTNLSAVIDVIYNPIETVLVRESKAAGIAGCNGLYMLIMQGIKASEYFFDHEISCERADSIYQNILRNKQNIVLIGMPGSGKSTVGQYLAKVLNRPFYDSDTMIETKIQRSISDIFACDGEAYFRQLETEMIKELSKQNGAVIATGGGVILDPVNTERLSQNGKIFFLDRPLETLIPTADRPTADSKAALKKRFEERYSLYREASDIQIRGEKSVETIVKEITDCFSEAMPWQ